MKISTVLKALFALMIPVAFVSCGGGYGGSDYAGGGIGGTGISVGKITGFGSVIVNGIEFDTTGARIIKDGVPVVEVVMNDKEEPPKYLRRGMIVIVRGEFSLDGKTGRASSIEFRDNLEGPVSPGSIDLENRTFEVLSQTVKVDGATVFEGTTDLTPSLEGSIVEVSGFTEADGTIQATYIEVKTGDITEFEVKGKISNFNMPAGTFDIGNLTVDYSDAELKDMPAGGLRDELFVEVKGTLDVRGVMIARSVEAEDDIFEEIKGRDKRVEFEGVVTGPVANGQFEINSRPVKIVSATRFEDGANEADLIIGVKVEVEGNVDSEGVIIATEISIESEGDSGSSSEDESLSGSEGTSIDTSDDGGSESGSEND